MLNFWINEMKKKKVNAKDHKSSMTAIIGSAVSERKTEMWQIHRQQWMQKVLTIHVLYCICTGTSLGPVICEPSCLDKVKKIIDFTSNISSLHVEKWMDYLGTNYHEQISRPGLGEEFRDQRGNICPPPHTHTLIKSGWQNYVVVF